MKLIGTKTLETDRLILRKIKLADYKEAYSNWCNNDNVSKYVVWNTHKNEGETRELFEIWVEDYKNLDTFRWIVELKDTKELIGTIDVVNKKFLKYDSCEIGYCYGEKYWNKGYATEALKRVIKFLFEEVDAYIVFADHLSNNPGSGKVMEKSGMKFDGKLRQRFLDKDGIRNDLLCYSITKDEYYKELKHE